MKAFLDHIRSKITTDLPEIKTVRKYREQFIAANKDYNDTPFRYPCIFVEFVPTEYFNYNQYRDVDIIVRFHVGVENYMIEKDEDMDLINKIDRSFYRWRGNDGDDVNFTTFEKIVETDEPNDDNVNIQIVEFKTRYREIDSIDSDFVEVKPVDLDLTGEIKE